MSTDAGASRASWTVRVGARLTRILLCSWLGHADIREYQRPGLRLRCLRCNRTTATFTTMSPDERQSTARSPRKDTRSMNCNSMIVGIERR